MKFIVKFWNLLESMSHRDVERCIYKHSVVQVPNKNNVYEAENINRKKLMKIEEPSKIS